MSDQTQATPLSLEERLRQIFDARGLAGTTVAAIIKDIVDQVPSLNDSNELKRLVSHLHEKQCHPDYVYDTTETGRKTGESKKPEGNGWLPNNDACGGDRNWVRDEYSETEYWMRLKTDALSDEVDPFKELKPVVVKPFTLNSYLTLLRQRWVKGYMPSSTRTDDGFHSKPYYGSPGDIANLTHGTGTYALSGSDIFGLSAKDEDLPEIKEGEIWFGLDTDDISAMIGDLDKQGVQVLTNLFDPEKQTYVRMVKKDGKMGRWIHWFQADFYTLALNPALVEKALDVYA